MDEPTCYQSIRKILINLKLIFTILHLSMAMVLSEHRLGNFLKTVEEDSYYLSTKVGRYLTPEKKENINRGAWAGGLNLQT